MKITITIINNENEKKDIQVDNTQRIKTTLKVLKENMAGFIFPDDIKDIRIKSSGRRVLSNSTYEEAEIYTGTELVIE